MLNMVNTNTDAQMGRVHDPMFPFLSGCGLLVIEGPAPGWQQIEDADALVTMAITRPCIASRILVWVDGVVAFGAVVSAFEAGTDNARAIRRIQKWRQASNGYSH